MCECEASSSAGRHPAVGPSPVRARSSAACRSSRPRSSSSAAETAGAKKCAVRVHGRRPSTCTRRARKRLLGLPRRARPSPTRRRSSPQDAREKALATRRPDSPERCQPRSPEPHRRERRSHTLARAWTARGALAAPRAWLLAAGAAASRRAAARGRAHHREEDRRRRASAAPTCAPAELARAEASLEFLSYELDEGNYSRAEFHHAVALESVDRAIERSTPDECASDERAAHDDRPDRDGDGIPDDIDKCPDEPEDFDGFQDEDGCPDPDNDGDGILDVDDKCPNEPGPARRTSGCPSRRPRRRRHRRRRGQVPRRAPACPRTRAAPTVDTDGDGIPDRLDKCPTSPRTSTASRTTTAAPIRTTTATASPTSTTSAPTSRARPRTTAARCRPRRRRHHRRRRQVSRRARAAADRLPEAGARRQDRQADLRSSSRSTSRPARPRSSAAPRREILDQVARRACSSNPDLQHRHRGPHRQRRRRGAEPEASDAAPTPCAQALIERGVEPARARGHRLRQDQAHRSRTDREGPRGQPPRRVQHRPAQARRSAGQDAPEPLPPLPPLPR